MASIGGQFADAWTRLKAGLGQVPDLPERVFGPNAYSPQEWDALQRQRQAAPMEGMGDYPLMPTASGTTLIPDLGADSGFGGGMGFSPMPMDLPGLDVDPQLELQKLRTQAIAEAGQPRSPMLAPHQPILPSPPPMPTDLSPMGPMNFSIQDLADAVTQGPPTPKFLPSQQDELSRGEQILNEIRGRNALHAQGIFGTDREEMDPNSPMGKLRDAIRSGPPQGMTMGQYAELPPEMQGRVTSWSSGFGPKPDAFGDLIKEKGPAISTSGQIVPYNRLAPGRQMPMGLGEDGFMANGTWLPGAPRTQEEIDASGNIAEQNLLKKGYAKGPMGWVPPEAQQHMADAEANGVKYRPANMPPVEEMQRRSAAYDKRQSDKRQAKYDAYANAQARAPGMLEDRGRQEGMARRMRMAGIDPGLAEIMSMGGNGMGNDLATAAMFGPGYVLQNNEIKARTAALDKQIDAANKRGDAELANKLELQKNDLANQNTQRDFERQERGLDRSSRETTAAADRRAAFDLAAQGHTSNQAIAAGHDKATVDAAGISSKGPQAVIAGANSPDPGTRAVTQQQLNMPLEQRARLDIQGGRLDTPEVTQWLGQLYDNDSQWDDTSLLGKNSWDWTVSYPKHEAAFVRNLSTKLGLPEELLRSYYRKRTGYSGG